MDDKQKKSNAGRGRPKEKSPTRGLKINIVIPESGRLSTRQELLVSNTIILYGGDIVKTCKFLKLPQEMVSEIYLKYNQQINQALSKSINDAKANKAINESLDIMEKHIKEIKKKQKSGPMYAIDMDACLSTVDRLVKVKQASSDSYYKCLSGINETVIKTKMAEKVEEGTDFGASEYLGNQKTVAAMLAGESNPKAMLVSGALSVEAKNSETGEVKSWLSMGKFCEDQHFTIADSVSARMKADSSGTPITMGNWVFSKPEIKNKSPECTDLKRDGA